MSWAQSGSAVRVRELSVLFARRASPSRVVGRIATSPRWAHQGARIQAPRTSSHRTATVSTKSSVPKQDRPTANAKTNPEPEADADADANANSRPNGNGDGDGAETHSNPRGGRGALRALSYIIPLIPIGLVLWEISGIELIWVTGRSMAPYLNAEYEVTNLRRDVMLARRVSGKTELERGMVIVFRWVHFLSFFLPTFILSIYVCCVYAVCRFLTVINDFRSPRDPSYITTKRIIGLAGDRVTPRPDSGSDQTPVIIPWNHLWVEGDADDSRETLDSNAYGPISRNLVEGRAVWLLRPTMKALRWEDWEGDGNGNGNEEQQRPGWKQRRRVEKGAVAVQEPMTFS